MVDLSARAERLDGFLSSNGLEAVWFARPAGFAWLTGGTNVVDAGRDIGVAAVGYDGSFRAVAPNDEISRLSDEELPDAVDIESYPWYADTLADAVATRSPTPAAADFDVPGLAALDARRLRRPLTDDDIDRYRELGREAAVAVETVCRNLEPTDPEYEVAAGIEISLATRGVNTPSVLVGGADRAGAYPRCTPGEGSLGAYALVSVTAERGGLHASLTRTVVFDAPDDFADHHLAASRVAATALTATRVAATASNGDGSSKAGSRDESAYEPTAGPRRHSTGDSGRAYTGDSGPGTAADVFAAIRSAYAAVGFDDGWTHARQGGATGFTTREWVATPTATDPIVVPMGYAWTPTIRGARSEDTHLVTADRFETLTKTGRWPTHDVESVPVDGVPVETFELHAPVVR